MAKIYDKTSPGPHEHVLILAVRELYVQPFEATDWTDLRVGWFVSVCGETDPGEDDTITGLTETIGTGTDPLLPWTDRFAIGLTDQASGRTFCGYTNAPHGRVLDEPLIGKSLLSSSDAGIGTTNSNYWRPKHEDSEYHSVQMIDGGLTRAFSADGSQIHFAQANIGTTGPAGYATLISLRFTRPDSGGRARIITMSCKKGTHSGDVLFSNDPSKTALESQLEGFPTTVQTFGPIEMSQVPDTFYMYWPFGSSRLRIHSYGILKVA